VPTRKKQPTDAEATPATGRKKTTTAKKPSAPRKKAARAAGAPAAAASAKPNGAARGKHDLVIVESPAKAKTINKYLGGNFKVLASYGHVRDLIHSGRRAKGEEVLGVNIAGGWLPRYVVQDRSDAKGGGKGHRRSPRDILNELGREAAKANRVFLATDPDREGEAIAWHIEDELRLPEERTFRIAFNEITQQAVQRAIASPGKIDMDKVQSQEARRLLDRVVGYPLSDLLGKKVTRGLSAGRVQSVAVRLVVDREREIEAFKPEEYWKITALLAPAGTVPFEFQPFAVVPAKKKGKDEAPAEADGEAAAEGETAPAAKGPKPQLPEGSFQAELAEWAGKKFAAKAEAEARAVATALDRAAYAVSKVEQKDQRQNPQPPFTTSTLQQQASLRLHFSASRTMQTAQRLYEGVPLGGEQVALITYMRTDSTRVSNEALSAVRDLIKTVHGDPYLPAKPNVYASGKSAQEAHEAIRPTDVANTPQVMAQRGLHGDEFRLYQLIYQRFVASQMTPAVFAVTNVEVTATAGADRGLFKAQGRILKFDGFRRVLPPGGKQEDALLPNLAVNQALDRLGLTASQHFTEPPPRYNEASLVKSLEKEGIGRPSTYASIISTIQRRGYVEQRERRFFATELGKQVTDLLTAHFPRVLDLKFTSHMEEELDQIERRELERNKVLWEFWGEFEPALKKAEEEMPAQRGKETGESCPRCGKPLVENYRKKDGSKFIGCSAWKEGCKYVKPPEGQEERPAPIETEHKCPNCGKSMVQRMGRRGPFLGCTGYPECKTTMNLSAEGKPELSAQPTEHTCEKCGSPMVLRQGRRGPFLACTGYPKCKNALDVDAHGNPVRPIDTGVTCDKCGQPMVVKKGPRGPFLSCSGYPKCRNAKPLPPELKDKVAALMPKKPAAPSVEVEEPCPECGGPMKVRQGRKGPFLGCAKYPKCKGVREASPELLEKLQEAGAM
jgi:DNA topoisomerase-1